MGESIAMTHRVQQHAVLLEDLRKKVEEVYRLAAELRERERETPHEPLVVIAERLAALERSYQELAAKRDVAADILARLGEVEAELRRRRGGRPKSRGS